MSSWDSDYYDDDYFLMTCPECKEPTYSGDFMHSKNRCVICATAAEENASMKPLVDLVKSVVQKESDEKV